MKPESDRLNLHAFMERSRANGPGERAVVWVQGCTLACPGCFNPRTHDAGAGRQVEVVEIADRIVALARMGAGLTITGGEPFQQVEAVTTLLESIRRRVDLSVLLFTGYSLDEARALSGAKRLLDNLDVVIAGRYESKHRIGVGLVGSANQTIHFLTDRHVPSELENVPEAEVLLKPNGVVVATGIVPIRLDLGSRRGAR